MPAHIPTFIEQWKTIVANKDITALQAILAEEVIFYSPAVFKPYQGRTAVTLLLANVIAVFDELDYTHIYSNDQGGIVMQFQTSVDTPEKIMLVEGVDIFQLNAGGLISDMRVMLRPLSATQAVAQLMLERLQMSM
ncbi:MAG: nuclear transport factor 2 family protein [Chloroflexi bacterium]|nr:nuclear transport factor 2 family protein [Chloroflexota bacterium]